MLKLTPAQLLELLEITPGEKRRAELRRLASDPDVKLKDVVANYVLDNSPLFSRSLEGTHSRILVSNNNWPALRDLLPWQVLFGLIAKYGADTHYDKAITWTRVTEALMNPGEYSLKSHGSKTGYLVGWHKNFYFGDLVDQIKAAAAKSGSSATTTTVSKDTHTPMNKINFDLTTAIAAHDGLVALLFREIKKEREVSLGLSANSDEIVAEAKAKAASLLQEAGCSEEIVTTLKNLVAARAGTGAEPKFDEYDVDANISDAGLLKFIKEAVAKAVGVAEAKGSGEGAEHEAAVPEVKPLVKLEPLQEDVLNKILSSFGVTGITFGEIIAKHAEATAKSMMLERQLAETKMRSYKEAKPAPSIGDGIPECKNVSWKKAYEVFMVGGRKPSGKAKQLLDIDVPVFEWKSDHPFVPPLDEHYAPQPATLAVALEAIVNNRRPWTTGHTGAGKTTLWEFIAATLAWPFVRVNLDGQVTRLDMLGREKLTRSTDPASGQTVTISEFVEGVVPQAMRMGAILCCDEVSFIDPNVAYVFQRVLEGKGLALLEDGNRFIRPADFFRVVATDNTRGQGDETGFYAGAQPQSLAFMDRFTTMIEVGYLPPDREAAVLKARVPALDKDDADSFAKLAHEVREAFTRGDIALTMSPRGLQAAAEMYMNFHRSLGDKKAAREIALEACILNKCGAQDRTTVKEIVQRIWT